MALVEQVEGPCEESEIGVGRGGVRGARLSGGMEQFSVVDVFTWPYARTDKCSH